MSRDLGRVSLVTASCGSTPSSESAVSSEASGLLGTGVAGVPGGTWPAGGGGALLEEAPPAPPPPPAITCQGDAICPKLFPPTLPLNNVPEFNKVPLVDIPTPPPLPPPALPGLEPLPLPPLLPLFGVGQITAVVEPPPKHMAPNASLELPFTFCAPPFPTLIVYIPVGITTLVAYKTAPPPPPPPLNPSPPPPPPKEFLPPRWDGKAPSCAR